MSHLGEIHCSFLGWYNDVVGNCMLSFINSFKAMRIVKKLNMFI